ncbi:MAG TPA: adenylate/guanylate cyclase domain-containing protein [Aquihabitans sp.]|nr:adenylate/guanylate cyclase domain-containing protein [Aquihabitans sp.]
MTCTACGAEVGEGARFCASCGRALRAVDDERRVVTVVFADLVGFTSLSERLDPERVKDLVDRCFDRLAADVTSFGGQVDKIVGDALVALFGATVAHEDDPERAVRAALRMQVTLAEEAAQIDQDLQMRVGVNTGEVLVGAMRAAGSVTAMGDVVNTASRLQTVAQPGEVLVGPATHAATHHTIAYEPRGLLAARGREEPVDTWAAVMPTLPPGYRARRIDVPLVGRAHELDLLTTAVDTSFRHDRALLALVVGDVGMGKSRLADEVARAAELDHEAVVREGRCVPYGEANVWWPVADALRDGLGVQVGDEPSAARARVREVLAATMERGGADPEVQRTTAGLLTLLGYDDGAELDPATVRQEAGRALGVYASASAKRAPLVLQISDLHWADPAVLDLIDDTFAVLHHCPVVILATARPALLDQWAPRRGRHNALTLHLDPLDREASDELLEHLLGAAPSPATAEALFERAGGNPFFLEELVSLLDGEAAAEPGRVAALPDTLRGLVAARLDDLSPDVRAVVQDASVIGQTGPMLGLREMGRKQHPSVDVDAVVAQLVADEIMVVDGEQWRFRSDLLREVAYQTITKADRAKNHLGIARFIEDRAAALRPRPPWVVDQLAHHYGAAVALAAELGPNARTDGFPDDLADHARRWVTEAADRARRDQAVPSAVRLYTQALDLLDLAGLEPDGDRARAAEAIRLLLGRSAVAVEGWELALARGDAELARRIAERLDDDRSVARAVLARGSVQQREGDLDGAIVTVSDAAARFRALGDVAGLGEALRQRCMVEIFAGRVADAEVSAEAALAAATEAGDRSTQAWASQNLAWTAFVTGRPDDADRRLASAIEVFGEVGETQGLAWSLGLLAWVRFQQRRVAEAAALGEQVLDEARARSDPWASAMMTLLQASVRLWTGRTDEAVELADAALRTFKRLDNAYGTAQATAVLGRAMVMAGRVEDGFALLGRPARRDGEPEPSLAEGMPGRMTRFAASVQVGEPGRGADVEPELHELSALGVGGADLQVGLALAALQRGEVDDARRHLGSPSCVDTDPNVLAIRSLVHASAGLGDAAAVAEGIDAAEGATYQDRAVGALAAALEAAAGDHGEAAAQLHLSRARAAVHPSEDRIAHAVVELGAAAIARRLGSEEAEEQEARAEHLLAKLGLEAEGWRRAFALALRTPVG